MKIAVIGAMKQEIDGLKKEMQCVDIQTVSGIEFAIGRIHDIEVIAARAGIGKVNAAICAQTIALQHQPDAVINIGVAGGYSVLNIGDVVVADYVVQHDMDTTACGDLRGFISGIGIVRIPTDKTISNDLIKAAKALGAPCCSGVIVSGDQFINSTEKSRWLHDEFSAMAYEMEGAAVGHVCYQNKIPFAVLRAVSDNGDDVSNIDFQKFVKESAEVSISIILEFFKIIKNN